MKNKKVLQYLDDVSLTVKFIEVTNFTDNEIENLKTKLGNTHYNLIDHSVIKSHNFYSNYTLELDAAGFVYLYNKTNGESKVKVKGEEVENLLSSFNKYKNNISKVLNSFIKEFGSIQITTSPKKRKVWVHLLKKLGFDASIGRDVYLNTVVNVKKYE